MPGTWDKLYLNMDEHNQIKEGSQTMQKSDGYFWGVYREKEGLTFLIVNRGFHQGVMESSLETMRNRFHRANLNWRNAEQHGLKMQYERELEVFMQQVSQNLKAKQISRNLTDTTETMKDTYQKVLLRGKQLDSISQISDQLGNTASMYRTESQAVKRAVFWDKYRWRILAVVLILLIFVILLMVICGGVDFKPHCISAGTPTPQPQHS